MSDKGSINPFSASLAPAIFRIAGLINFVGVLVFSLALTNERLTSLSPVVFSRFGLVSIMLWGAAYFAVSGSYRSVPGLVAVFAVEKLIYFATWLAWLQVHGSTLPQLLSESPLTGTFYAIYGVIDLAFGVFFAVAFWRTRRT